MSRIQGTLEGTQINDISTTQSAWTSSDVVIMHNLAFMDLKCEIMKLWKSLWKLIFAVMWPVSESYSLTQPIEFTVLYVNVMALVNRLMRRSRLYSRLSLLGMTWERLWKKSQSQRVFLSSGFLKQGLKKWVGNLVFCEGISRGVTFQGSFNWKCKKAKRVLESWPTNMRFLLLEGFCGSLATVYLTQAQLKEISRVLIVEKMIHGSALPTFRSKESCTANILVNGKPFLSSFDMK